MASSGLGGASEKLGVEGMRGGKPRIETRAVSKQKDSSKQQSLKEEEKQDLNVSIQYSLTFERYLAYTQQIGNEVVKNHAGSMFKDAHISVLASYAFLDGALEAHPDATLVISGIHMENFFVSLSSLHLQTVAKFKNIQYNNRQDDTFPPPSAYNEGLMGRAPSDVDALDTLAQLVQPINPITKEPYFDLDTTREQLSKMIPPERFYPALTANIITQNYNALLDIFTRYYHKGNAQTHNTEEHHQQHQVSGLALSPAQAELVLSAFPHLVTYPPEDVLQRIRFMLQPTFLEAEINDIADDVLDTAFANVTKSTKKPSRRTRRRKEWDWPKLCSEGYGANLTVQQATGCVRAVPEILALYHSDAVKPSIPYFFNNWKISPEIANQVQQKMTAGSSSDSDDNLLDVEVDFTGCAPSDPFFFAFLRSQNVAWDSLRIIMDALPTATQCDTEVHWDVEGPTRSELKLPALNFLRERLHLRPADVVHMLKTHSRLSGYSVSARIKPTLDALQSSLGLSCSELRSLVIRMPSLLGMGTRAGADEGMKTKPSALSQKLRFFFSDAGMDQAQLRKAVLKQSSLLQYSLEDNLRPKLRFLTEELGIDPMNLGRIIYTSPTIMGLSLKNNLRAKVEVLSKSCDLSYYQVGSILSTSPPVLTLSLKRKIEPCLSFLQTALNLSSKAELGEILMKAPRLLVHSVETSLSPKLQAISDALRREEGKQTRRGTNTEADGNTSSSFDSRMAVYLVRQNPSLLVLSNAVLQDRLERIMGNPKQSLRQNLQLTNKGRSKLEPGMVDASVVVATTDATINESRQLIAPPERLESIDFSSKDEKPIEIVILVTGSVYPSEGSKVARGIRKSNGVSVYFPQVARFQCENQNTTLALIASAAKSGFGTVLPSGQGTNYAEGVVCLGTSILKPSRRRCDLYACHVGLKMCLQILKLAGPKLSGKEIHIRLFTESQYAWDMLKDVSMLCHWGEHPNVLSLRGELSGAEENEDETSSRNTALPFYQVTNVDLLHPLAQTVMKIVGSDTTRLPDGSQTHTGSASVRIQHTHDLDSLFQGEHRSEVDEASDAATEAAIWQFQRARGVVFGTQR
jgi:hypothetical protein